MTYQRLINAGAALANCAFNLAQRNPGEFTARDIVALDQARKDWDAARREPDATPAPGAPAGFKLVPIEPTKAMLDAVIEEDGPPVRVSRLGFVDAYKAMLDAAPGAPGQEAADAKDAARYREFFASGLPITFLGVEYRTKAELDAAIDAALPSSGAGEKP